MLHQIEKNSQHFGPLALVIKSAFSVVLLIEKKMPPPRIEPGFQQPQCCVLTTILRWQTYISLSERHRYIHGDVSSKYTN